MPTPATLTFVRSNETVITMAGATATAIEFLTALKALIDASTYWNATQTNDAGNGRGYLEFAPKSGATLRGLLAYSTGTVTGAAGSEMPSVNFRNAPWATANTTLAQRMWIGVSPDAGTTANTPYQAGGSTQPYTKWTKFFPISTIAVPTGRKMWIIESAEGLAVQWDVATGVVMGFEIGEYFEALDRNSTKATVGVIGTTAGDTTTPSVNHGWALSFEAMTNAEYGPPGQCGSQHSAGAAVRSAMAAMGTDGVLYGCGRNQVGIIGAGIMDFNSGTNGQFQNISLGGGIYNAGSTTGPLGYWRQHFWGPKLLRAQGDWQGATNVGWVMGYDEVTAYRGLIHLKQSR